MAHKLCKINNIHKLVSYIQVFNVLRDSQLYYGFFFHRGVGRPLRRLKINEGNEERNIIIQPYVYELFIYMKYENDRWINITLLKRSFGDIEVYTNYTLRIVSAIYVVWIVWKNSMGFKKHNERYKNSFVNRNSEKSVRGVQKYST